MRKMIRVLQETRFKKDTTCFMDLLLVANYAFILLMDMNLTEYIQLTGDYDFKSDAVNFGCIQSL